MMPSKATRKAGHVGRPALFKKEVRYEAIPIALVLIAGLMCTSVLYAADNSRH
jgi:hypothetical protein